MLQFITLRIWLRILALLAVSVADPWNFGTDPDPDLWFHTFFLGNLFVSGSKQKIIALISNAPNEKLSVLDSLLI
jgi:hypothetical protein